MKEQFAIYQSDFKLRYLRVFEIPSEYLIEGKKVFNMFVTEHNSKYSSFLKNSLF